MVITVAKIESIFWLFLKHKLKSNFCSFGELCVVRVYSFTDGSSLRGDYYGLSLAIKKYNICWRARPFSLEWIITWSFLKHFYTEVHYPWSHPGLHASLAWVLDKSKAASETKISKLQASKMMMYGSRRLIGKYWQQSGVLILQSLHIAMRAPQSRWDTLQGMQGSKTAGQKWILVL